MSTLVKQSQSDVKDNNLSLILNTIIQNEPLSRVDIVRITHISKPTVSSLIDVLINKNLALEIGEGKSTVGRKPRLLKFNSTLKYFLAIDMGREDFKIAVSDLKGTIIDKRYGEFVKAHDYNHRLTSLNSTIRDLIKSLSVTPKMLLKMIFIAPGVYVEKDKGLNWFADNKMHANESIQEYFRNEFQTEVLINHSTKLSLWGEKTSGKARGYKNVIYIDFAYGLGCSYMIDGKIYLGSNNSAGEIGYFYSSIDEFNNYKITPYEFGALENRISGRALQRKGIEATKKYGHTKILELANRRANNITGKIIFEAAIQGDPYAYSILRESFNYFNMALCNAINMLDPELVIFGGGFSKAEDFLVNLIVNEIKNKLLITPVLTISELKNNASIIGAIAYLIEHTDFFTEI